MQSKKSARKTNPSPNFSPTAPAKHNCPNLDQLPMFMNHILEDAIRDGHRRFLVSGLLAKSVESHQIIRLDLTIELNKNKECFLILFGTYKKDSMRSITFGLL
jgi:hypothetical protein